MLFTVGDPGLFLDDLDLLGSTHHRHYTGTIVLHQPSDPTTRASAEGRSYVEADVVDGQQRLTTIVLLLNEISGRFYIQLDIFMK